MQASLSTDLTPAHGGQSAQSARPRLPTLLLGGWLGSGKTTLLNRLLREAGRRRIAVLVNDFGEVNLDADLIVGAEAGVLQLAGGCLCCSFGDDLLGTLRRVAAREPRPDVLVVELSGVALPHAVRSLVQLVPEVLCMGSLVLVDATQVRRQALDKYVGGTVREQLGGADWLLLSKADLVDAEALAQLGAWLKDQPSACVILPGDARQVPADLILGWGDEAPAASLEPALQPTRGFASHPMRPRAHPGFVSRSLRLPPGVDLSGWLTALDDPAWAVLRAKARVGDGQGRGRLLQWAAGRGEVTALPVAQDGGHLVLIGLDGAKLDAMVAASVTGFPASQEAGRGL